MESRSQELGRKMWGSCYLLDTEFQLEKMKEVLEMDGGDGCTTE
jgi:hypothetical protein